MIFSVCVNKWFLPSNLPIENIETVSEGYWFVSYRWRRLNVHLYFLSTCMFNLQHQYLCERYIENIFLAGILALALISKPGSTITIEDVVRWFMYEELTWNNAWTFLPTDFRNVKRVTYRLVWNLKVDFFSVDVEPRDYIEEMNFSCLCIINMENYEINDTFNVKFGWRLDWSKSCYR